jgi:hypothetical protein
MAQRGRPRKPRTPTAVNDYKDEDPHEYVKTQLTFNLDFIVDKLLALVEKGNERAVFYAMDRILGKPVDQTEVSVTKKEKTVLVSYVNDWRNKQLATEEELNSIRINKENNQLTPGFTQVYRNVIS